MTVRSAAHKAGVATDPANREKDDFYPTPPHAVEALLDREKFIGPIWEPACGDGAISTVLIHRGHEVYSSDLVDRGYGSPGVDFLMEWRGRTPNIITNPPFKLAAQFAWKALELAPAKVAFICKLTWLESIERRKLFTAFPLKRVLVFSERISMQRGRQTTDEDAAGMIAFAWYIWDKTHKGPTELDWI